MLIAFFAAVLGALFLTHCAIAGRAVLRIAAGAAAGYGVCSRAGLQPGSAAGVPDAACGKRVLAVFYSICLGMLANMAGLFALGMMGWLNLPAVSGMALVRLLAGMAGMTATVGTAATTTRNSPASLWLQLSVLAVIFVLCIAASLHPPGHWDDTMYQLPLARHYAGHQAIVLHEYLRFPLFPQNFNLLFSLGLMLGDALPAIFQHTHAAAGLPQLWQFGAPEVFAQVFATLPLFVIALGMWGASLRYLNSGLPGLLAGLTLFMIGPVKSTLGFAYIDNGLALFCWAATLAVAGRNPCTLRYGCDSWALLAGLLAGAACGTKYFGVVFTAILGGVLIASVALQCFRNTVQSPVGLLAGDAGGSTARPAASRAASGTASRRSGMRTVIVAAVFYACGVLLAGSAWYIRSYLISGDPAHPAGAPVFGYFLWNEGDLARQYAEQGVHGVGSNPLKLPAALLQAGVLLWLPAFAGLFLRNVPAPLRIVQAAFIGYILFWFFVSQVPRYLGPVYGLGGFLTFHALHRAGLWGLAALDRTRNRKGRASPPVFSRGNHWWPAALVLAVALGYAADRSMKYGKEFASAEAVLATNSGYALYQQANAHVPRFGNRLVQAGFEDGVYFFQGTVIGDWFGPGRYRDILECDSPPCNLPPPAKLEANVRGHDARMLLLNRRQFNDLNDTALTAAGWKTLAVDENGMLLAVPEFSGS